MRLFEDFERSDQRPKLHGESDFEFLNRSARPPWERVRMELETWFATYPPRWQADLAARFQQRTPEQHLAAWWDLYVFRLFAQLGFDLEPHPALSGSPARPDFHAEHESPFYIEAVTAFSG